MAHRMTLLLVTATTLLAAITVWTATPPPHALPAQAAGIEPGSCKTPLDLMLVLDGSDSIYSFPANPNWTTIKDFSKRVVAAFSVSAAGAHIGVAQFSTEGRGRVFIPLSNNATAINAAINGMDMLFGDTDIQEGLALGQAELAARGRAGVPHVIILLTDGEHNEPGDPFLEAQSAKNAGTEIFAIGVGGEPNIDQLNAIASDPDNKHVFSVTDFDGLAAILSQLVTNACPTPEATPPPVPGPGEPNDDPASCSDISFSVRVDAAISPAGDEDYYCFTGHAGQTISADVDASAAGSPLDPMLALFAGDGVTILAENDDFHERDPYLERTLPSDGRYIVRVLSYGHPCCGGAEYTYSLLLTKLTGAPTPTASPVPTATSTPVPSPGEPNDDPASCSDISFGVRVDAAISPAGDEDYYCFTGHAGQTISADVDASAAGSPLDSMLTLFAGDGITILADDDDTDGRDPYLQYQLPSDGRYVLRVLSYGHPCCGGVEYTYSLLLTKLTGAPTPTSTPAIDPPPPPAPPPPSPSGLKVSMQQGGTVSRGANVTLALDAQAGPTGIGAYTIDIVFDPSVVRVKGCVAHPSGVCSIAFAANTVRVTGASVGGLTGDLRLADISFEAVGAAGTCSTLHLQVTELISPDRVDLLPVATNDASICIGAGLLGDVNCDGRVSAIDAQLVLQDNAGLVAGLPCPENADVNRDGRTNAADAMLILQYNAGLLRTLPP